MATTRGMLRASGLALAIVASVVLSSLALLLTNSPVAGVLVLVALLALWGASQVASLRGLVSAALLAVVAPGVLGESSVVSSATALLGLGVIALSYQKDRYARPGPLAMSVLALGAVGAGLMVVEALPVAASYALVALVSAIGATRSDFLTGLARGVSVLLSVAVTSYLVTLIVGFQSLLFSPIEIGHRRLELYLPLTLATGGPPFIPGSRRAAFFVGEPGLLIYYLLPVLWLLLVTRRKRERYWLVLLVIAVAVCSQSLAIIFIAACALLIGVVLHLFRRRWVGRALLLCSVLAILAPGLVDSALQGKATVAGISLSDRALGDMPSSAYANINLLVAYQNTPILAVLLTAALVLSAALSWKSIPSFVIWAVVSITAVFAQPSQWQVAGWLFLILVANAARATPIGIGSAANVYTSATLATPVSLPAASVSHPGSSQVLRSGGTPGVAGGGFG